MLLAVDLDDQPPLGTEEVDDVGPDRRLAAETQSLKPPLPETLLKPQLRLRHLLSHRFRELPVLRRHDPSRHSPLPKLGSLTLAELRPPLKGEVGVASRIGVALSAGTAAQPPP
jgi:hypothetical protein